MTAYLIVRSEVPAQHIDAFDLWYQAEHLPDAKARLKPLVARRGWSDVTPGIHFAILEFPDIAAARSLQGSEELKWMVAEYDRVWQGRVQRTREYVEIVQTL